jgi:hypothetical protein
MSVSFGFSSLIPLTEDTERKSAGFRRLSGERITVSCGHALREQEGVIDFAWQDAGVYCAPGA